MPGKYLYSNSQLQCVYALLFPISLLFLKKSKRSAVENSEEYSAKYSNSNNSGNWLKIIVGPRTQRSGLGVVFGFWWPETGQCREQKNLAPSEGL